MIPSFFNFHPLVLVSNIGAFPFFFAVVSCLLLFLVSLLFSLIEPPVSSQFRTCTSFGPLFAVIYALQSCHTIHLAPSYIYPDHHPILPLRPTPFPVQLYQTTTPACIVPYQSSRPNPPLTANPFAHLAILADLHACLPTLNPHLCAPSASKIAGALLLVLYTPLLCRGAPALTQLCCSVNKLQ